MTKHACICVHICSLDSLYDVCRVSCEVNECSFSLSFRLQPVSALRVAKRRGSGYQSDFRPWLAMEMVRIGTH